MQRIIFLWVLVLACSHAKGQGRLSLTITNIKAKQGVVSVALFTNASDYLKKPAFTKSIPASDSKVIVAFEALPRGTYAISVMHDTNNNGKLDTNFMGIPKEGFAFGNNATGMMGPASFEKASIIIESGDVQQAIALKHY